MSGAPPSLPDEPLPEGRGLVCRDLDPRLAEQIEQLAPQLGPAGRRVLRMICDQPVLLLAKSAIEIAALADTSDATVVRTVQHLGFGGLPELKQALRASLLRASTPADDLRRTLRDLDRSGFGALKLVLEAHERAIGQLSAPAHLERLQAAAEMLAGASRIVTCGMQASVGLAHYASFILARLGWPTRTLHALGGALADQLIDLREGDVLLFLAPGRSSDAALATLRVATEAHVPIVLLADGHQEALARHARVTVAIPCGSPGHVTLRASMVAAVEALCLSLAAAQPDRALSFLDRLGHIRDNISSRGRPQVSEDAAA